ncbi:uncharacterized protein DNG_07073 [Cephalotrichum gorgonifer]|uniref:Uncharacterized protein n=1 Tax=Cephalotrichum gorgonifer TaxID=2041049 RepID=A0AAE8N3L1_9PEZI|nr:uncharacterized protein DNG_07073 [Cephalotrichum gorgonifer]
MVAFRYTAVLLSTFFAVLCGAQFVQDAWISPATPDFSSSIQIGKTYEIRWSEDLVGFFGTYAPSIDITDATLWLTVSDDALDGSIKIKEGINVQTTNRVEWEVALTDAQLQRTTKWVFRFLKADTPWAVGTEEISSPPVIVKAAPAEEMTTATTGPPAATGTNENNGEDTSSTTATNTGGARANPTDGTPENSGSSAGLSGGAKGGIAGGVIGGLAIIGGAVGFLLWRRKKTQGEPAQPPADYGTDYKTTTHEVSGVSSPMTQPGPPSELPGASYFQASELEAPHTTPPPPRGA